MNLLDIAQSKQDELGKIASNAVFYLLKDENGCLKLKLHKPLDKDPDIVCRFKKLGEMCEALTHPRILKPLEYQEDDEGGFWTIEQADVTSLYTMLRNTPGQIANELWKEQLIAQLMDCVDFLHRREAIAVELSFNSILVTTDNNHNVRLLPPCSGFLEKRDVIWTSKKDFLAPELLNPVDQTRCIDIYGIGYIISHLYPMADMPYKYKRAVEIATTERVDKRFDTVGEMIRYMQKQQKSGMRKSMFMTMAIVLLFSGIIMWGLMPNEEKTQQTYLENESDLYKDSVNNEEKLMDEVEKYLRDTTYMNSDTAFTLSDQIKERQRERMRKAAQVFRMEFSKHALPLVRKIYQPELMNGSQNTYEENAKNISVELQQLQVRLANQYQIEPSTATRIAGEVIQELADQCTKK